MEKERDEQPKKDPEAMKALTRVQVRSLDTCSSGLSDYSETWGPFLESPGNLTGSQTIF